MQSFERMKKAISLLLCLCMVLQFVPASVLAVEADGLCEHHAEHAAECGYVEGVSDCAYHCDVCLGHDHGDEVTEEDTEPAPVCDCGTDDPAIHATTCAVYVAPENPVCYCAEKCTEVNEWCDVCGFDYTACGGTDTAVGYAEGDVVSVTIGGETTYYTSIIDAVAKANESGNATITLLQDTTTKERLDITKSATLDLNGNTLSCATYFADDYETMVAVTTNGAKLTIIDSIGGGKLDGTGTTFVLLLGRPGAVGFTITSSAHISGGTVSGAVRMVEGTSMTVSGGTVERNEAASTIQIYTNATLNVSGGQILNTFSSSSAYAISNGGTLNITGGTVSGSIGVNNRGTANISGNTNITGTDCSVKSWVESQDSTLTITGGNYTGGIRITGGTATISGGSYTGGIVVTGGTATISDGTITESSAENAVEVSDSAELTISGGTFSATAGETYDTGVYVHDGGTVKITGGTITSTAYGVYNERGSATITGGSISGETVDLYVGGSDSILNLTLDEGKTVGATFPRGITVEGTTLAELLATDTATYWGVVADEDTMLLESGEYVYEGSAITDKSDITIRAICDHKDVKLDYITTETTHTPVCSVCNWTGEATEHTGGTATCQGQAVCEACGVSYGDKDANIHTPTEGTIFTDNGDGTHSYTCACGAAVAEVPHTLDVTTGKCVCGADMTAIATVTDGTNTYYATDAATLNQAVTAILETGSRTFTVELPADAEAGMNTAIRRAICDTEGVADGSIHLTLKGVTSIPGTTNWDGVAFGPRNAQWDENNVEIVSHEEVTQLASVNLPDVTEIGAQAFLNCSKLTSITAPKVQSIGDRGLQSTAITSIDMPLLKEAGFAAFCGTALTEVSLPSLETAGVIVFGNCEQLRTVDLPKLQNLSQQLFTRCTSLVSVSAPAATSMGIIVFKGCSELVSITLPGVTELTNEAFAECTKLENITFGSVITKVNANLFDGEALSSGITLTLNCGQEKAETLPTAAGTNVEWASFTWKEVKFAHSYVNSKCTACGEDCTHTGGTATCTTLAVCEACGASYGEVDKTNHDETVAYENGFCPNGCYEPAALVTNENYESFNLKADYVGYYAISNAGQLFWFAQQVNVEGNREIKGVLTADIDLENKPWTPIGSTGEENNNFRGVFDGRNYTIRGLNVEGSENGVGFFGEVRTGTVKNFTIFGNVVVNTEVNYVGGVIGSICGLNGENDLERNGAVIQNITSFVNVTAKAHGIGMIGGFVGYANHQSLIEKCAWYGTFDAGEYRVDSGAGGFIGKIQENTSEVTIRNCGAYGTIKTGYAGDYNNTATIYMGGFLSFSNTGAKTTIENCLFAGRFERGANLTDEARLGAFGTLRSVNAIKNCYYLGDDGLAAVHSDSDLNPGSGNVEITSVTGEELRNNTIATQLGEYWTQGIHYPIFEEGQARWHSDSATYTYTDNGDGTHKKTCNECGYVEVYNEAHSGGTATCIEQAKCEHCGASYGELGGHSPAENTDYTDNGNGTHNCTCAVCGGTFAEAHAMDVTTGKCVCGADMTVVATVTDGTNTCYAVDADTLNQAVTAILETGSRTFTVNLPADAPAEMITAIRRAICDTEGVADGSIHLTLKGVTAIPDNNYDGVGFGVRSSKWDDNGEQIVSPEVVTRLASIDLPDVLTIGIGAFELCENLASVTAPKVQTIGENAFAVTALTSVEFPELTTIPFYLFFGTDTLTSAKFPKVTTIEDGGLLIGAAFRPAYNPTPFPLELTAEGDITFNGSDHFNNGDHNYSGKVDLVLCCDKADKVTKNEDGTATWQVRDDLSYTFKSITFTEHNFVDGICTVCGETCDHSESEHTTATDNGDGTHKATCTVCGDVVASDAHTTEKDENKANCQHGDICDLCGASYGEVDKTNHDETVAYVNGFCPNGCYEPAADSDSNGYYDIDNAGKLYWFAAQVNSGKTNINGELKANIVVNENVLTADGELNGDGSEFRLWTPIGTEDNAYTGDFCGLEHTVSGLYFNDTSANFDVGLFGYVRSGEVNHVGVIDSYFNGFIAVGGVVGHNEGIVEYVYSNSYVGGTDCIGGVVGDNSGTVEYAYNLGSISGSWAVGGVTGTNYNTVKNCYNIVSISGDTLFGDVVGDNSGTLENCYYPADAETDELDGTTAKTWAQFKSGEVAYLLGRPFGQNIGTNSLPVLYGETVYYGYTSCGDTEKVYTNNANVFPEKPDHTQKPTFTVNGDGTHSAFYSCCGTTVTEAHDFENDAHKCVCGVVETFTVYWGGMYHLGLETSTSTYGQDFVQVIPVPENTHLRIDDVYLRSDSSIHVNYTYENGVLTIAASDLPAADIDIDCYHYVKVTCHANGGEIKPYDGFPEQGDTGFAEDRSYWVEEWPVSEPIYPLQNGSAIRPGYTFVEWRDESGKVYPKIDAVRATVDVTIYAQWQCNHTIGGVEFRDNGDGTHNGYCGECDEPLGNYVEQRHVYDETTHQCVCGVIETFAVTVYDGNENIVVSLTNTTATYGQDFTAELTSDAEVQPHYELIDYTVNDETYENAVYENGKLTIPAVNITGDIKVWVNPYVIVTIYGNGGLYQQTEPPIRQETWVNEYRYGNEYNFLSEDEMIREGYEFVHFTTEADGTGTVYKKKTNYAFAEDLDLYAQWEVNTYTYHVETYTMDAYGNYGEPVTEERSAAYGTSVNAAPTSLAEGFYLDEAHEDSHLTAMVPANHDLVLKVYIGRSQYPITWDLNGGGTYYNDLPESKYYGISQLTVFDGFVKEGHTFSHLEDASGSRYVDASPNSDCRRFYDVDMPVGGMTLKAIWTVNAYALHVQDQTLDVDYGTALADALADITPEKTGYTHTGWTYYYLDEEGTEQPYTGTTMPAYELYAEPVYEAIQYNITWDMSGCTYELRSLNELPTKLTYTFGSVSHQVDFAWIKAPEGYELVGFVDGNGNKLNMNDDTGSAVYTHRLSFRVTGDMTVKAVIQPKSYMATWTSVDSGGYEKAFKYGETITIPTSDIFVETFRKAGYTLTGWEGYTEGMTMPIGGVTFTAKWQINAASLAETSGKYTGKAHTPVVTVEGLTEGTDFTVTYPEDMVNVGEKVITVTGKLGGTTTVTYTITKVDAPVITFPTVLNEITYGQQVQEAKLSFYENEYGTFNWASPSSYPDAAGEKHYALDFYPKDLENYDWAACTWMTHGATWIENRNALCTTAKVIVNRAESIIETEPVTRTLTYTGQPQELVTAGSVVGGTLQYSVNGGEWSESVPTATEAGRYYISYKVVGNSNYIGIGASALPAMEIDQAVLTITAKDHTITYGDEPSASGVEYSGFVNNETESVLTGTVAYTCNYEQYDNAGTYKITPDGLTADNYKIIFKDGTLTVNKKPITVEANAVSKTYGDADPELTYKANGLVNGDKLTGELKRAAGENVGSYAIEQNTLTAGNNYSITYTGAELTINKKPVSYAEVSIVKNSLPYTGKEQTVELNVPDDATYNVVEGRLKATDVGMYEVVIQFTGNYSGTFTMGWQITAVAPEFTVPTANTLYYTGKAQNLVAAGTTDHGTMVYSLTENGEFTETIPTGTDSGTYTVYYKVLGDSNHTDTAVFSVEVVIDKAKPQFTVPTGLTAVYGDTLTKVALPQGFTWQDATTTPVGDAGENTFMVTFTPEDTVNYATIKDIPVTITVSKQQLVISQMSWNVPETLIYNGKEQSVSLGGNLPYGVVVETSGDKATNAATYTATATFSLAEGYDAKNYEIVGNANPLTAQWAIQTKDISGAEITLGAALTYNGAEQTQRVASAKVEGLTATWDISGNTGTEAGSYTLTITGNGNFSGTATKTWSIAKKDISDAEITLGTALTYNGTERTQTVTKTEIDGLTVTGAVSGNTGTDAKDYTLTVTGNGNFTGTATKAWSIAKAPLTVTARSRTITYGDTPAANGVEYSGFVGNENETVVKGQLSYTYNYEQFGNVGTYTITPKGPTADNYEITFVDGTLTVDAKAITVTADAASKTYSDTDPTLTYMVEGLVNGDELTGELKRGAGEDVGTYAIEQGTLTAGDNYTITYTGADLTIQVKTVTVAAKDQTITYGKTIDPSAYTISGVAEGDTATVTLIPSTAKVTANGMIWFDILICNAAGEDMTDNYFVSAGSGSLVIQPDTSKIDGLTTENVSSANEADIKAVVEMMASAESTKEEWTAISTQCKALLEAIEAAKNAVTTENTEKVEDVTSENVKAEDKENLEKAKDDMEKALSEKGSNMTEGEKQAVETEIQRIEAAIQTIENVEAVTEDIIKLPETVTPGNASDEAAVKEAKEAYDKLSDHEKTLVDEEVQAKLDAAVAALAVCDGKDNCPSKGFTDVDATQWYHAAIDYVLRNGIMQGDGTDQFGPNDALTRAMIVQVLYNLEGKPAITGKDDFADTEDNAWYAAAVLWASQSGIVEGYGNGNFGPNDTLTREQMATILCRYAAYKGADVSVRTSLKNFTDGADTSDWAEPYVQWAVANNIINGCGDGTLRPTAVATRAQVAQIILNYFRK